MKEIKGFITQFLFVLCWLALSVDKAFAQFELEPLSRILDNTAYQFFSGPFRENRIDFTKGTSSLELLTDAVDQSLPQMGGFISGNQTVTFDYNFADTSQFQSSEMTFIASTNFGIVIRTNLADTQGQWCRESFFLPSGVTDISLFATFVSASEGALLIDNMRTEAGRNVQARQCFDSPSLNRQPSPNIAPIVGLLLDDDTATAGPGSFSGSISLPEGIVAGTGGVTFEVSTFPRDFVFVDGLFVTSSVDVTIPAGQSNVNYSIDLVDESPSSDDKQIGFECLSGCESLDITTSGYWSEVTGVSDVLFGTRYSHFAENRVDLELEAADTFSGTVALPNDAAATGEEFIVVRVSEVGPLLRRSYTTFISPLENETSWPFSVGAPSDSTASNWSIELSCLSCDASVNIATQYATQLNGGPLSTNQADRFLFSPDQDFSGIELELLEAP